MSAWLLRLVREDQALSSVEYSLILALVGAGILAVILQLGAAVSARYDSGTQALQEAGGL